VDEQRRVYAMAAAGEEPQRPRCSAAHARLRRGATIASVNRPKRIPPASVIRTFVTSTSLAPAPTLSYVIVRKTAVDQPAIKLRV